MNVDSLPIGGTLNEPIYDENGVLLLDRGLELTDVFVETLRLRGISSVRVGAAPKKSPPSSVARRMVDGVVIERLLEDVRRHLKTLGDSNDVRKKRRTGDYQPGAIEADKQHFHESVSAIEEVLVDAENGMVVDIGSVQAVTAQNAMDVADDPDLAVHCAFHMDPSDHAFRARLRRAALQSSVLSLAVGVRLGMGPAQLLHLGTAAILSDIGLLKPATTATEQGAEDGEQPSEHDLWQGHPQRAFDQLTSIKTVPGPVLQAIRQHHELIDGTGFPHGLADDRICLAARIIGLTQAYLSLTSPLDGREGFVPADSVAYLLYHSLKGRFCLKVMQALVHVISVYPQGSSVRLADQRTGTVVRCAANDPMRPVIRLDGEIYDLGQSPNRIIEPLPGPAVVQRRLPTRFLKEILW